MNEVTGYVCLGSVCLGPIITFFIGLAIGRGAIRLPYKLVKVGEDEQYAVEE